MYPFLSNTWNLKLSLSLLSFHHQEISHVVEKICLLVEYAQLMALQVILSYKYNDFSALESKSFTIGLLKMFSPGLLIEIEESETNNTVFWFGLVLTMLIIKYFFLACTILKAIKGLKLSKTTTKVWSLICLSQSRVLFLLTSSFFVIISQAAIKQIAISPKVSYPIFITSVALIMMDYIISLIQRLKYSCCLPTREYLASKSNIIEIITVTQKIILLISDVFLPIGFVLDDWIISLINIFFSLTRDFYYLKYYPPYKLQTFYSQGILLGMTTSLSLSCFLRNIANLLTGSGSEPTVDNSLIIWLVITPVVTMLYYAYMRKITFDLIGKPIKKCSHMMQIQKISIIKNIIKQTRQNAPNKYKNELPYLLNRALSLNVPNILGLSKNETAIPDIENKSQLNKYFVAYLELLGLKYPRNEMIKLQLAYYYGCKLKLYVKALEVLRDLDQHYSSYTSFNISFLRCKIQQKITLEEKDSTNNTLSLREFFMNLNLVEKLKNLIIHQADFQLLLCLECKNKNSNLTKILGYSKSIDLIKSKISKESEIMLKQISDHYLEPLLIYAHYKLKLNYSLSNYLDFHRIFSKKLEKQLVFRKVNKLCQENLYDNNKILIILGTQKENIGSIIYCSKSIKNSLGWNSEELIGRNINGFFPYPLSRCYLERLKSSIESNEQSIFKKVFRSFMINKDGYLHPMDLYLNSHPLITNGIYLDLILRPVKVSTQYMLVDKNGIVQSMTENIAARLDFLPKSIAISQPKVADLSEELNQLNKACDVIASMRYHNNLQLQENLEHDEQMDSIAMQKFVQDSLFSEELERHMSFLNLANKNISTLMKTDQALALYEKSKTEGQTIILAPLKSETDNLSIAYKFEYKVVIKYYASVYMKVFSFIGVGEENIQVKGVQTRSNIQSIFPNRINYFDLSTPCISNNISPTEKKFSVFKLETQEKISAKDFTKQDAKSQTVNTGEASCLTKKQFNKKLTSRKSKLKVADEYSYNKEAEIIKTISANDEQGLEITDFVSKKQPKEMKAKLDDESEKRAENFNVKIKESIGSQRSRISAQRKVEKAFDNALNIKYYSKTHTISFLAFYLVLSLFLIDNIVIQIISSEGLQKLGTRVTIVDAAESMNDLFIRTQRNMRFIMNFDQKKLNESYFLPYNNSRKTLLARMNDGLAGINDASHQILLAVGSLDKDDRDRILENNVTLYYNYFNEPVQQSFQLNTFQSIVKIYEYGIKIASKAKKNMTQAMTEFNFYIRNTPNNFLINSEMVSDMLLSVSEKETNANLVTLVGNLAIMLTLLAFLLIMSLVLIIQQYNTEKQSLSAFVGLSEHEIDVVASQISSFKSLLQNETDFENLSTLETPNYLCKFVKGAVKPNNKNRERINPDDKGIRRRYLMLISKITIFLGVLAVLSIVGYIQKKSNFNFMYSKLQQIHFSRRMISKINLAVAVYFDLFSENNKTEIWNTPTAIEYRESIDAVKLIIDKVANTFIPTNSESDQAVQRILYDDGCQLLLPDQAPYDRCIIARKGRDRISFMTLLSELERGLEMADDRFYQSNRTPQQLFIILTEMFTLTIIPYRVITDLGKLIAGILGQTYQDSIVLILKQKNTYDIIVEVIIISLSIVIWFTVFNKLREADNNFKKVLKTLPISIIMSSFTLKAYLLKTSRDALAFIKSEI